MSPRTPDKALDRIADAAAHAKRACLEQATRERMRGAMLAVDALRRKGLVDGNDASEAIFHATGQRVDAKSLSLYTKRAKQ